MTYAHVWLIAYENNIGDSVSIHKAVSFPSLPVNSPYKERISHAVDLCTCVVYTNYAIICFHFPVYL